jgi:hypothetical protein
MDRNEMPETDSSAVTFGLVLQDCIADRVWTTTNRNAVSRRNILVLASGLAAAAVVPAPEGAAIVDDGADLGERCRAVRHLRVTALTVTRRAFQYIGIV